MLAAVLGSPIAHSLSPVLHNAAYRELGLPHEYSAVEVTVADFPRFIATLNSFWLGVSLTMPLKEAAFSVAGTVTPVAVLARSINTLICGDGLEAHNTDVVGIVRAVEESAAGPFRQMLLLGSGATARSAVVAAGQLGVERIVAIARNHTALAECAEIAARVGVGFTDASPAEVSLDATTLTVNTTPAGVADALIDHLPQPAGTLLDVVYHPWPTVIARHWQDAGATSVPGHLMLLHQAAKQVELMTGEIAPVEAMRRALQDALQNR